MKQFFYEIIKKLIYLYKRIIMIILMTSIITSSEWLNFMWTLHNKVRNGKGSKLTGMGALNEINNFLLLFFIERNFDKYKLDETCRFSYLYNTFCSKKVINDEKNVKRSKPNESPLYKQLHYFYCDASNQECILRKLLKNLIIKSYLKNETIAICAYTDNVETGRTIQDVIQYMYEHFETIANNNGKNVDDLTLDDFGFDAFGDAYEKFKQQSCQDSGKSTGQHFTPVLAKDYVIEELKPKNNEVLYEPACGTGGFIHRAMKYLKDNGKKYDKFISNVKANECNSEIYKPLSINMLIHGIPIENIKKQDSLELGYCKQVEGIADVIATNPPFGPGDKLEVDSYWGPLLTGKNVIKESCMAQFIMHIYHTLKPNGRCGTISDRGIISNGSDKKNSWLTKLRKFMLENMNVYKIVLLPSDTFDYTTFATCILFMRKGEVTKSVEFRELKFKEVNIDGQKQKVIDQDTLLGNISIEQIIEKNYSLKPDDYFKVEEDNKQDTTGWVKLGDVCEILTKSKHKAGDSIDEGHYNFYTSSSIIKKSNFNDYKNTSIIIGSGGNGSLFIDKNFSCSADNFILNCNINIKYVYYFLKINFKKLYELYKGNGLKHLSQIDLKEFLIPNLPQAHQEEIVNFLDEQFTTYNINKLNKNIPLFKLLINKEYDMAAELLHFVYRQMAAEQECENIRRDMKGIFQLSVYGLKAEKKKLGDIVEDLKCGKSISKANLIEKGYPYFGANGIIGYTDSYLYDGEYILVARNGTIGAVHKFNGKFYPSDHTFVVKPKNNNINYIFKYLTDCVRWKSLSVHNGMPGITKPILENIQISIPSLEVQEEIIKRIESLEQKSSHYNQYAKMLQIELDNITEIISNMTIVSKDNEQNYDQDNELDNESNDEPDDEPVDESYEETVDEPYEEPIEKPKKTKVKKTKIEIIEYKGKSYILEDDKVYKMDEDGNKGKHYGFLVDGKIKKLKLEEKEIIV